MSAARRPLWPPLASIESGLLGDANADQPDSGVSQAPVSLAVSPLEPDQVAVPDFLNEAFARREAVDRAGFSRQPVEGQIRSLVPASGTEPAPPFSVTPMAVLLDRSLGGAYWTGWIVAPESDYASNRDVLIEERDDPVDPVAAMIQTWNSVTVDPSGAPVLGQLSPERLDAVRSLVKNIPRNVDDVPQPGFVFLRDIPGGHTILTGTPLGELDDPRRRYQKVYQLAARGISVSSAVRSKVGEARRFKAAFAVAATLVLGLSITLQQMHTREPDDDLRQVRGIGSSSAKAGMIRVIFKPDARDAEIRKALDHIGGQIVSGPDSFGEYTIQLGKWTAKDATVFLRTTGLVDSVSE